MLTFADEFGLHVLERLKQDPVVWLTTVAKDGTPQPNPVWFYWDGEEVLIYSQPHAAKLKNIARNPKVSIHLEGAAIDGGDVVVLTGEATIDRVAPPPPAGYRDKYDDFVKKSGITWKQLHADYSVSITIFLTRYRGL